MVIVAVVLWCDLCGEPHPRGFRVARVKLDADVVPPELPRGDGGGTRTGEGVKHGIARTRIGFDEEPHRAHRLLGRVEPVAGILPREDVVYDAGRPRRALGQKIRGLMTIL